MLKRTEGIVLRSHPFGEADLLVTYLTLDLGVITAFAKSPRKIKSRFGSSLEPLTHARIAVFGKEDARLPRLTQSDIINPYQEFRESLDCYTRLSGMVELTVGFLPEGEANRRAFTLLRDVMEAMLGNCGMLYDLLYRIRLLEIVGYAPRLDGCARCHRHFSPDGALPHSLRFYVSQGSLICVDCAGLLSLDRSGAMPLPSNGAIKLYESLMRWDISKASRIKVPDSMLAELRGLLVAHMEYRLSRPLRVRP